MSWFTPRYGFPELALKGATVATHPFRQGGTPFSSAVMIWSVHLDQMPASIQLTPSVLASCQLILLPLGV